MKDILLAFVSSPLMLETNLTPQAAIFLALCFVILVCVAAFAGATALGAWYKAQTRRIQRERDAMQKEKERLLLARTRELNRFLGIKDES